jgi:hypothetical protein
MKQKVAELEKEGHEIIKVTPHQILFKDKDTLELRIIYRLCFSKSHSS